MVSGQQSVLVRYARYLAYEVRVQIVRLLVEPCQNLALGSHRSRTGGENFNDYDRFRWKESPHRRWHCCCSGVWVQAVTMLCKAHTVEAPLTVQTLKFLSLHPAVNYPTKLHEINTMCTNITSELICLIFGKTLVEGMPKTLLICIARQVWAYSLKWMFFQKGIFYAKVQILGLLK